MIEIRKMTKDDLGLGLRLTQEAGWNHLESDWRRFINLWLESSFVAEFEGHAVGTTMTFISDRIAWVAMVLVEKASRSKGVGTALLKHALDYLDACKVKTVRLDATHLGQPLYEKLGFLPEYEVARFKGIAPSSRAKSAVIKATPEIFADIIEYDKRMTGTHRAKMLNALFREFPENLHVVMQDDDVEGFVTFHPGRNATQIGPCTATRNAGPALLSDALSRCAGKVVFVDVPIDNVHAVKIIGESGIEIQRRFLRMYRGKRIKDNIDAIWASSGPEKG